MPALAAAWALLKRVPLAVYLAIFAIGAVFVWGNHRFHAGELAERARWEAKVAKAEAKVRKAERDAQRAYDEGRDKREADTDALRDAANRAPEGGKVKAVLEALRDTQGNW